MEEDSAATRHRDTVEDPAAHAASCGTYTQVPSPVSPRTVLLHGGSPVSPRTVPFVLPSCSPGTGASQEDCKSESVFLSGIIESMEEMCISPAESMSISPLSAVDPLLSSPIKTKLLVIKGMIGDLMQRMRKIDEEMIVWMTAVTSGEENAEDKKLIVTKEKMENVRQCMGVVAQQMDELLGWMSAISNGADQRVDLRSDESPKAMSTDAVTSPDLTGELVWIEEVGAELKIHIQSPSGRRYEISVSEGICMYRLFSN